MKYKIKRVGDNPYIYIKNNIITDANDEFVNLSGYTKEELTGKSLVEAERMIRIDSQIHLQNIKDRQSCYMFTKAMEIREVIIFSSNSENEGERKYYFNEKQASRLENKIQWTLSILQQNNIGAAVYSAPEGILLKTNSRFISFCAQANNKSEKIIGSSMEERVPGYKGSCYEKLFLNVVKSCNPYNSEESRYVSSDNRESYWDACLLPISVAGEVKYVIHTAVDVTEKVLYRKQLEQKTQKMKAIFENMSDDVVTIDKDYTITILNNGYKYHENSYENNMSLKDVLNEKMHYSSDGKVLSLENICLEKVFNGEKIKDYRVTSRRLDGLHDLSVSGSPIYDDKGNVVQAVICSRDITEQKKYQESKILENQYALLNNIINNIDIPCGRFSYPDFKAIDINNKAFEIFKKVNPELRDTSINIEKTMRELLCITDECKPYEVTDIIKENTAGLSIRHVKANIDGREKYFKVMLQNVIGLNDQVVEIYFVAIDITAEVEEKNKMKDALKAQEIIFANVAHELKTPLNVIFSTNQLMEMYLNCDSIEQNKGKVLKALNSIRQNCYRFTKLIDNIVDTSKAESGFLKLSLSNENIVQTIEDITQSVSDYIEGRDINIIFDTNTEEKIIACDNDKIERIMLNLISNSIKFTNSGGSILVNFTDKGETVEISVKDSGIGMDESQQKKVFKRFYQAEKSLSRNSEGTGIGLSLVKSLVELHGGKITVESEVGKGSVFKVEIPSKIVKSSETPNKLNFINDKVQKISVEFSDIYSLH